MTRNIDIALVRAFLAVMETGSVTRAALLLNLTQAAVSQQIKRLEELFETQLFERIARSVRPTPAGERLAVHAQRLLAINDEVWGLMSAPDHEGEVRVGVPWIVVHPHMAPVLQRFDRTWPRVQVTLTVGMTADLLDRFNKGELDLTLATERDVPLHAEEVLEDPLVWVGATGGAAHLRRPLPVSLGDASSSFHGPALAALTDAGIDWRLLSEVSSLDAVKASLLADIAVGPMLRCAVPDGLQVLGRSSGLPPLPNFHVNLHVHRSGSTPIVEEFARFIRQGLPRAAAAGGTMLTARSPTRTLPAGAATGKRAGSQQRPKGQPG